MHGLPWEELEVSLAFSRSKGRDKLTSLIVILGDVQGWYWLFQLVLLVLVYIYSGYVCIPNPSMPMAAAALMSAAQSACVYEYEF
jgi:hypothetical protein